MAEPVGVTATAVFAALLIDLGIELCRLGIAWAKKKRKRFER